MVDDLQQRQKALDITKSFIVQAPAGSGKTELLTQRYLKLLSLSKNPESVLALTFTNKAVAELKERVISSLQMSKPEQKHKLETFELAQKVLELDKKYNWCLLQNQHRLSILTLDSLAAKITHNYPQADNFATKRTLEDFDAQNYYQLAAKNTLLQIDKEEAVLELLNHFEGNSDNFINSIIKMLSVRTKWINKLFDTEVVNLHSIKSSIENIESEFLETIQPLAEVNFGVNFFNLCQTNPKFTDFRQIPNTIEEWRNLKQALFTAKNTTIKRTGFKGEQKVEFEQILQSFNPEFIDIFCSVEILPNIDFDEKIIGSIAKVLKIADNELQDLFNKNEVSDFTQITIDGNNALNDENDISDISLYLDYKIEHILLDEFQDTSYLQLELISKMVQNWEAESGRTLFVVGDPMQSIYLFRGAQVGVFLQVQTNGIAGITLENLTLTQNFRSTKSIVETTNHIFNKIFPKQNNIDTGAISYVEVSPSNQNQSDALNIYPFIGDDGSFEAEQILEIITNNPNKEIAILCSAIKHSYPIVALLNSKNIKFEAINNTKLIDDIFTIDLLNILKILLNKADKLAWLSVLRSPYCGVKLADILILSDGDIWQNILKHQKYRIKKIGLAFSVAFDNFGSFAVVDIFNQLLQDLGIIKTLNSTQQQILIQFSKIVAEYKNKLEITILQQHLEKLYTPSISSNIKVMTIHKSKGLEFDIVILPGMGRGKKHENKELMMLDEFKDNGVLLATNNKNNATYRYLRHIAKKRHSYEKLRVLYVAITRAKEQVHILANIKKDKPTTNSFLSILWDLYKDKWSEIEPCIAESESEKEMHIWGRYESLNDFAKTPVIRAESLDKIINNSLNARIIGTIIHKFLQLEDFNPSQKQIENYLSSSGISPCDLNSSSKIVAQMLENTQQSSDFEFVFKQRKSTLVEAELFYQNKILVIDRLFIDAEKVWIIDFKTSAYEEKYSVDDFIKMQKTQHQKQLKIYKKAVQNIYQQQVIMAIFLTSIGKLVEL